MSTIRLADLDKLATKNLNFTDEIEISDLDHLKVTSSRNTRLLLEYTQSLELDVNELLQGCTTDRQALASSNQWLPLQTLFDLWTQLMRLLQRQNPRALQEIGRSLSHKQSVGRIQELAAQLLNARTVINLFPSYERAFNNDTLSCPFATRRQGQQWQTLFKFKYFANFRHQIPFAHEMYYIGLLQGVPGLFGLPPAQVDVLYCEYALEVLLTQDYRYCGYHLQTGQDIMMINGEIIAQRIRLKQHHHHGQPDYLVACPDGPFQAWQVTKTLRDHSGELVVQQGDIFNAPYSLWQLTYQDITLWQNVKRVLARGLRFRQQRLEQDLQEIRRETLDGHASDLESPPR